MEPWWTQLSGSKSSCASRWQRAIAVGSIIVLATFSFFFLSYPTSTGAHTTSIQSGQWLENLPQLGYEEIIRQIWGPMKLNITAPRWTDPETNKLYRLPSKSPWTEKLGKRVCILDVDTRPFENEGELFSEDPWEWTKVEHLSSGMMGHYMYSVIHGYDYLMLRSPKYTDRHDAWGKVLMMQYALRKYDFVIFFDSDAMFANSEIPLEWLFNYWGINNSTSVAIASESKLDRDKDDRGNPGQNSGFMILQNNEKTHELFKAWAECPDTEERYPGCARWKMEHLREQDAFSNHIRYDKEFSPYIKILPCTEANGYPDQKSDSGCVGAFVRHHWMDKQQTKRKFGDTVMRAFAKQIHGHYMDEYDTLVEDLRGKAFVGSEMVESEYIDPDTLGLDMTKEAKKNAEKNRH